MPSAVEMVARQANADTPSDGGEALMDMTLSEALEKWVSKHPNKVDKHTPVKSYRAAEKLHV